MVSFIFLRITQVFCGQSGFLRARREWCRYTGGELLVGQARMTVIWIRSVVVEMVTYLSEKRILVLENFVSLWVTLLCMRPL